MVSDDHKFTDGPAVNQKGEVFFTDVPGKRIYKEDLEGKVTAFAEDCGRISGLMFGSDGYLYACRIGEKQIARFDNSGELEVILEDAACNDLVVLSHGGYYTDHTNRRVWHVNKEGQRNLVDEGIEFPNGVIVSPDQTQLIVSDTRGRFLYSFRINDDGSLSHKQEFGYLHLPSLGRQSGADGMTMDREGRTYVTTKLGIQVLDQLGRVHLIIACPNGTVPTNVVFGGPSMDTLYITCRDKVFKRRINATGIQPWQPAQKPPKPRL